MKVVDLSHKVEENMPVYPGSPRPSFREISTIGQNGFRENLITLSTHTGTHIDLPAHLLPDGKSLDDFGADSFFGAAIKINCTGTDRITKERIAEIIRDFPLPDFLLFYTGWDKKWETDHYYTGFPVLDKQAAVYIASLAIKGVGIDAISFDRMNDDELPNHRIFMDRGIILIENLCNLNALPESGSLFGCLPVRFSGLDGCPVRAFGLVF